MASKKEWFEVQRQAEDLSYHLLEMSHRETNPELKAKLRDLDGKARSVLVDLRNAVASMYDSNDAMLAAWLRFVGYGDPEETKDQIKEAV
jgi:hypothetical protein